MPSRKHSCSSIGSSLDDILSSSPVDSTHEPPDSVLTPKVLTAQEIAQQKEDAILKGTLGRQFSKDPYPDSSKMDKFVAETEKLAKFVESLDKATCSGPSHLDIAWKVILQFKKGYNVFIHLANTFIFGLKKCTAYLSYLSAVCLSIFLWL